jgi:hypothetical protein
MTAIGLFSQHALTGRSMSPSQSKMNLPASDLFKLALFEGRINQIREQGFDGVAGLPSQSGKQCDAVA